MKTQSNDLVKVLTSNHPSKPYFIIGGLICGVGLLRNNLMGLIMLGLGGAVVARGVEEMRRLEEQHDGNFHGTNGPPVSVVE